MPVRLGSVEGTLPALWTAALLSLHMVEKETTSSLIFLLTRELTSFEGPAFCQVTWFITDYLPKAPGLSKYDYIGDYGFCIWVWRGNSSIRRIWEKAVGKGAEKEACDSYCNVSMY